MTDSQFLFPRHIAAVLVFLLVFCAMTFPLALRLSSAIPGWATTDEPYASLWNSWRIHEAFWSRASLTSSDSIGYPFGIRLYPYGIGIFIGTVYNHVLSVLLTPVLTYNIQIAVNMILSAFLMYLLCFFLTGCWSGALLAGVIFGFCPYQFVRAWQHLGLTYNQVIPLVLLTAIALKERPSVRTFFLFAASVVLLFSFDYSVTYIGFIALVVFFAYQVYFRDGGFLKRGLLGFCTALAVLLPQVIPLVWQRIMLSGTTPASVFNPFHREFEDLFAQSARPLSYLLPSTAHPLFGSFTESFIGSGLYGESLTEHTLYVGWAVLLLAFVGWRVTAAVSQRQNTNSGFYYARFFVLLGAVAWFFSQPPYWRVGSIKIPMPSLIMYQILPMYRAYVRFGILLVCALSVLASFGIRAVLRSKRGRFKGVLLAGIVLFEFWNWPPYRLIDVSSTPAVYEWLKNQPGEAVAEYPLDAEGPNELYKFYQTFHGKKITNGALPGTPAHELARSAARLSRPASTEILRKMGVQYAIVHQDGYVQSGLADDKEELSAIRLNPDLELVRSFPAEECPRQDIMCVRAIGRVDVYELKTGQGG